MADFDHETIDGQKVIKEFMVLYEAWEMDNTGWQTEDGRVWLTSHGGEPYEAGEEFDELIEEARTYLGVLEAVHTYREDKANG